MAAEADEIEELQREGGKQGWTHDRILGEYQQYFIKRLLHLQIILPELGEEKIIGKKVRKAMEEQPKVYDVDYFLSIFKKKNVEKFTKFFEVLEATFNRCKDHKMLVKAMSKHLMLISDAEPEQKERIERVVLSAKDIDSKVEKCPELHQTQLKEGQMVIESESERETVIVPLGETILTDPVVGIQSPHTMPTSSFPQQKPESPTEEVLGGEGEVERVAAREGEPARLMEGAEGEEEVVKTKRISEKTRPLRMAEEATISPPKGYVEPRVAELFLREKLIKEAWLFHSTAHGVSIPIHCNAVPFHIDRFTVTMHAYIGGSSFKIPGEYEICTAIVLIQLCPKFEFLEPVTLRIPHSALFDVEDQPEDFVILRASDPDSVMPPNPDTPTSVPPQQHPVIPPDPNSAIPSNTDTTIPPRAYTSIPPIYQFTDIIGSADFSSSNYYVQVDLKHFCAVVGAKRKHRYRRPKSSLPLSSSLSRQGSHGTQRKSRRKRVMKKRIKNIQKGDSIGSSRQSSYEGSFEEKPALLTRQQSPLVRQSSSVENDRPPMRTPLHRHAAVQHDDSNAGYSGTPSPQLQQQSSSVEDGTDVNCNEICICCCSPEHHRDMWMTRFMIAPNHPTGRMALHSAVKKMERLGCVDMEAKMLVAIPHNHFILFKPDEWGNSDWEVNATSTPQISLDLVSGVADYQELWQPPHIDFNALSTNQGHCSSPLHHKICITGAEANGEQLYYFVTSTGSVSRPSAAAARRTEVIFTQSWLYQEDSDILQALNNASSINLSLCPDHCKLIADIALQMPSEHYEHLLREFGISEAVQGQLETSEQRNLPERMYKVFIAWINNTEHKATLGELKSVLRKVGIRDIQLCSSEIPLLSSYPDLYDKVCDRQLCIRLDLVGNFGTQWRFVGRYLGLPNADFDDLLDKADREGLEDVAYCMLYQWQKQCGREASVAALLKAIYRVHQLSPSFVTEPWWLLEGKIIHEILENDG